MNRVDDDTQAVTGESATVLRRAGAQAREEGQRLAETLRDGVGRMAEERKQLAAAYLEDVSVAIGRSSEEMRGHGHLSGASLFDQASAGIGELARGVSQREPGELLHEVEDFARRQPVLFYGVALLAGFGAVRFLRSSAGTDDSGDMP